MMDYRWQFGRLADRRSDVGSVEAAVLKTFVALTLQLSESQLKPVFLQLLHWGNCSAMEIATAASVSAVWGVGEDVVPDGKHAVWRFAHLCRRITMYRTLEALQDELKSIFTPFCADFLLVSADGLYCACEALPRPALLCSHWMCFGMRWCCHPWL